MNKMDKDEKFIYDRISKIEVDSSRVKKNVRNNLLAGEDKKSKSFFASTLALAMSLFLVVGASAAVVNNSEWFLNKFNPPFKEIVEPIDIYSEDKGIRVELIAGQKYENSALVYLSIQDISGENRITENTSFRDGLFLGLDGLEASYGIEDKIVNFDKDSNTIYYELNISTDSNSPLSEDLRLGTSKIYFDSVNYENEKIKIPVKDTIDSNYSYIEKSKLWGGSDLLDKEEKILETGNYSSMVHGDKNQWISNVGIIDNKLHIQIGNTFDNTFGTSDPLLSMKDRRGQTIEYESSISFVTDSNNKILEADEVDSDSAKYEYEEFIFPLEEEYRDIYEIYYTGSLFTGLKGDWEIIADLSNSNENILKIDKKFEKEGYFFEDITLSPLGLQISGKYKKNNFENNFKVELENEEGLIKLQGGGGSLNRDKSTFNFDWHTKKPIEVDNVKSIIIDDIKIPVK